MNTLIELQDNFHAIGFPHNFWFPLYYFRDIFTPETQSHILLTKICIKSITKKQNHIKIMRNLEENNEVILDS